MTKRLVVFSGGQDSTTCLFWAKSQGAVETLTIHYGQRHAREVDSARLITQRLNIPHCTIGAPDVLQGTSPLVSDAPLEQYKDHHSLPGGLEKTFVPLRNLFFLTLAANHAVANGIDTIVTGVCQEDYGGYPDCRQVFIDAAQDAICKALDRDFKIETPLMNLNKANTVRFALFYPGCYRALAYSHTAYDGAYPPTGRDHATLLRAKGFEEAGIPDPLIVRAVLEEKMQLPETDNYMNHFNEIEKAGGEYHRGEVEMWDLLGMFESYLK